MTSHLQTEVPVAQLITDGVAAFQRGAKEQAFSLLTAALQREPAQEAAWLWLSGCVVDPAARRYCLEQVVALNPAHTAAQRGLAKLPADIPARSPLPPALPRCAAPGCAEQVAQPSHRLCLRHWKASIAPPEPPAPAPQPPLLTASALGERLGRSNRQVNQLLAELGWIIRNQSGWAITAAGRALGGEQRVHPQNDTPFVVWPEPILCNPLLVDMLRVAEQEVGSAAAQPAERGFRERFPAKHRTTDGHLVRSKAELLIDDWLYHAGIVHAYERRLPIAEEAYCDFYVPAGRVYLEYWGLEDDPAYHARKQAKQALYRQYQLPLIELTDTHVRSLDDQLPQLLLAHGVRLH